MKLLAEVGHFKVWQTVGLKSGWYQVREGRHVVSRHDNCFDATREAERRLQAHWDEIAKVLEEHRLNPRSA